jgi:hypothetical protein
MPGKQALSALREMRSELTGFLRYLGTQQLVDNAGAAYQIGDSLNEPKEQGGVLRWGYRSGKLALRLATNSVVCPVNAKSLGCTLDIQVAGELVTNVDDTDKVQWIITKSQMSFDYSAESSVDGVGWAQFWHLDTHIDVPPAKPPPEPHPMFHLHFGGSRMANQRAIEKGVWGKMLEMRGPRFPHPPMDLILALDFILANATGKRWRDALCRSKEYNRAVLNSQRRFWKPYKHALSSYYGTPRLEQRDHRARLFWPTLRVEEI